MFLQVRVRLGFQPSLTRTVNFVLFWHGNIICAAVLWSMAARRLFVSSSGDSHTSVIHQCVNIQHREMFAPHLAVMNFTPPHCARRDPLQRNIHIEG